MMKEYQEKNEFNVGGLILRNWKEISLIGFICAMLFFIVAAFIPPRYKATSSIVISQGSVAAMDAYREAKSSEFIARTGKEVILSNSFMRKTLERSQLNWKEMSKIEGKDKQLKFWRKRVKVAVIPNTGVMNISIYTKDRELSKALLTEMVDYIVANEQTFLGKKDIFVSITNEPYYFSKPTFPNLPLVSLAGFVLGCLLAIILITFRSQKRSFGSLVKKLNQNQKMVEGKSKKPNTFKLSKIFGKNLSKAKKTKIQSTKDIVAQIKPAKNKQNSVDKINQLIEIEDAYYFNKEVATGIKTADNLTAKTKASIQKEAPSANKKSFAPVDLPVFEEENKKPSAADIANGYAKDSETSKEVSEEEIKKRLNQLLRGEL